MKNLSTSKINYPLDMPLGGNQSETDNSQVQCIYELFETQVKRSPDAIAVVFEDQQLTYRQLNAQANQLANYLKTLGVKAEVLVGICVERSLEMIVGLLGILKAGGAYVPLDPSYPQERLAFMLADSQVSVLLTKKKLLGFLLNNTAKVVCLDTDWENIAQYNQENPLSQATADNLAYVIYTSGSTGTPKGVMIQHQSLVNYTEAVSVEYQLNQSDSPTETQCERILQFSSISFDVSAEEIFPCLTVGATLVLRTDSSIESAKTFLKKCLEWQITVLSIPTAYWHELTARLEAENLSIPPSVRLVIIGGERALPTRLKTWHKYVGEQVRLINAYGPTEATISALMCDLPKSLADSELKELPIGKPINNIYAYVLDENLQIVPQGTVGELYLGGVGLARGYLNRPEITAEKFICNLFSRDNSTPGKACIGDDEQGEKALNIQFNSERLYKTGDLVRYLPDENFEFIGRVDQQVKIRGFRIELGEIESVISQHPAVQASVVVDQENIPGQKRLVAYVVSNPSYELPAEVNNWNTQHVSQAETFYNEIYNEQAASQDPTLNFIGWNSSYTDVLIPEAEMREWVNNTVERILALQPQHILELGCGTGMLMFRLAPHCEQYIATDFSQKVLQELQQKLDGLEDKLPQVILSHRTADNFEGIESNAFDTVILNSVSQHFPNIEYMLGVMEGAVNAVKPGGRIFVGDVRSLPLLEAFHTSIQLYKASDSLTRQQLFARVRSRLTQEGELVIDPAFFTALKQHLPKIGNVSIQVKHGSHHNELTRFRYDVTLHIGDEDPAPTPICWLDWQEQQLTLPKLRQLLLENQPDILGLRGIPNARLVNEASTLEWLSKGSQPETVGEWRSQLLSQQHIAIDPEELWNLTENLPYVIDIKPSQDYCYDVILQNRDRLGNKVLQVTENLSLKPWNYYANQPQQVKITKNIIPQIRSFLAEKLPDYMVPASFVMLDSLPITPNGKVDRKALPAPNQTRSEAEDFVAPRNPGEEVLVEIWAEVLAVELIGIHDNFFQLGGHSLLATQIMSRVREVFKVELPLRCLFDSPTVAGLAENIEQLRRQEQGLQFPPIEVISRRQNLPLSFAQKRLWFLDQLIPNNAFYNVPQALRVTGNLNIAALEQTLSEIVRRHEALRTRFQVLDNEPVQVITPAEKLILPVVDLRQVPVEQRETEALQQVTQAAQKPFNLAQEKLFRCEIFQLSEQDYILLVVIHHIVADGWSIGVFIKEIGVIYKALVIGSHSPLPELSIQYPDFAHWQQQYLNSEVLEKQLAYWKQQLAGAPAVINLPTDRPRPQVQTYRGATQSFILPSHLAESVKLLSQRQGVSIFMTYLAAFQTLLYRYTGQPDIVVGSPIANRHWSEVEELIGFFVNTLALRINLEDNISFLELLNQVREVALGAYAHQDLPFEQLVEALQPVRDLSHTPLFQVMFVLQNAPMPSLALGDLNLEPLVVETNVARFDLVLYLEQTNQGLIGSWEYNTDLFDANTIARIAGNFQTLLEAVVINPQQRVIELPLLSAIEQQQLLKEWNNTQVDNSQDICIHQLFEAQVKLTPDAVAVVFGEQQLTYQELNNRANQLAHYLQSLGVKPDVLVGICVERSLEMVVGLLGILKAGGAYVPLDPAFPQERIAFMLEDAGVQILLTQEKLLTGLPNLTTSNRQIICLDTNWENIAQQSQEKVANSVTPSNLAYVIYTSGSTGQPKGVAMSQGCLTNLLMWQLKSSTVQKGKTLQFTPISFDVSFQEIFSTWCAGGTLVLISDEMRRDPFKLLSFLQEQEIERLFLPFVALQQLAEVADTQNLAVTSLSEIITAGEQLQITRQLKNWLSKIPNCTLHNHYGPSESHVVTAYQLTGSPENWLTLPPIGRPIDNVQIYLLDSHLQPVPIGVAGELHIGGVGLAQGYLNRPELTAEKFIENPFSEDSPPSSPLPPFPSKARLYKTGDLARYLPDGNIEYLGRIDNQVKIRGFRIELGEIETAIAQHPAVRETVVIAREDHPGYKQLVAYIVPQPQAPKISEIRSFIKERLPEYMLPSSFVMLESLPLTPTGKVDRRALPAPAQDLTEIAETFVAARTPIEEVLVGLWAEILRLQQVGIHDNFFELGGHSLLGAQLISRIRSIFQTELPLRKLFECPTVASLAQTLETATQDNTGIQLPPILPVTREQHLPASFPQQQMWLFAQQQPDLPCYNSSVILRLPGLLNVKALEKALNHILQRHEAWRTNFATVDGLPVQIIQPTATLTLQIINLEEFPKAQQKTEALRLTHLENLQPFDLSKNLLLRTTLIRFNETNYWLLLTLHHIIYDGVSLNNVFYTELEILYKAYCEEKPSPLPELPIQYADFAVWQRQWLQQDLLKPHIEYWQKQLANLPLLELPTDHPRPAVDSYRGATQRLKLPKTITEKLKALAIKEGATLFMTLLAAFKTLLCRYSSQEDIPVGIVTAGSNRPELNGLVGLFINLLVLRTDLSGEPSFRQLLQRVREVTLEAHAHKDMPFQQLVDQLQLEHRSLGQNPLFQVMFLLDPPMPTSDSGWSMSHIDVANGTAMSDLTLELYEEPDGLTGLLEYSTDLFDAVTIKGMVGHYCTLLESIVANPEQNIFDLPIITAAEQQQLQQWNNTKFDYPEDLCLHQLFEVQVEKTPDAVAVTFEGEKLSYKELNQKANQLAQYLQTLGVKPDVMVGICVERSLEMAVGVLGILKAGGAYVPLDPAYPQDRLAFMLADTQVPVLLTQQRLMSKLPDHQAKVVCLDSDWQEICQFNQENISSGVTVDNLAYVIYTSGSTGRPKGICLEQRPLLNLLHWHYSCLLAGARTLQFASLSFDASFHEMFAAWGTGGKLFIIPESLKLDVIGLGRYISEQEIEKVILPVVLLQQLAESLGERGIAALQPEMFSNLKEITTTGEQLQITPAIAHLFKSLPHCSFHNHYGPSETHVVTALSLTNHPHEWEYHPPIGLPIANTQIYLVDKHFNLVPVGVPGELCIGGVSLARGYLNRPDLTAEKFIPNPFSENPPPSSLLPLPSKARLYRTGDLARYLPDGNIDYLGRIDHQVKIRGFRIELDEIEALLVQHPDVQEAVAIAREDVPGDKRLVAYVVSSLIPNRVPLETECLIEFNQNTFKLTTEDISVGGLCLVGVPTNFQPGANVQLHLLLPGTSRKQWLKGKIAWCQGQKAGINLDLNSTEQALLEESVDYLLEMQGLLRSLHRTITQNLRQFLQDQLPSYMIPDRFVILNSLPLTPNGKIDRRALPIPTQSQQQFATGFVAPRTPVEEVVAEIWMKLLGQQVSIHDNFLEVGGNSILAMQVISRLRDIFKIELPLRSLFESPTVAGMAQKIELMGQLSCQLSCQVDDAPVVNQDTNIQLTPLQKVSRPYLIPASFAQQRLWFLEQLNPGSPKYNLPLILEFKGLLNVTIFEHCCQEIISRHEALRTNFAQLDGQPVQVISANRPLHINVFDLEKLPPNSRPSEARNLVNLAVQQPFDLEQDPLLRITLIHLTKTEHLLVFVMHHIVSDGWSIGVFTRELIALYESFTLQKPCTLPELPIQYADFTIWQLQQLQGEVLEQNITYWKKQLGGSLPVLQLPTDRPRPAVQTFAGACQTIIINKSQTTAIKQLSRQENATLFMTLLTGFKILLYRYTGNEDILVGSPISGRHLSEIESLIGFFVNTQVLRTNLSGFPSFRELLKRVREVTLEAYAHKDLPFEKLVEAVQPERSLSQTPLVQVMFALQNVPLPELSSSWELSELSVDTGTAKFDLSWQFQEINDEIVGEVEYNTDLFDSTTIERLIGHFQTLLAAIVANPEQRIAELPLLTAAEVQQLQAWNYTETNYPNNACIHQLFEEQVEKNPDAVAVIFEDQQLTYSELNAKANQLAHQLRLLGVKSEVLVGICVERSLEMVIGILGILKAGGAYLPLDPAYPIERLTFMLQDGQVSVLLTQAHLVSSLPKNSTNLIALDTDWEIIAQQSDRNLPTDVTADNLAYVMYTSGSTGKPKGVSVIHQGVVRLVKETNYVNLSAEEVFLQLAPISFDASTFEIWGALLNGGRLAIMPAVTPSLQELGQALQQYQVTTLWLTAGLFHLMVDQRLEDLKTVRQLLAGGDVLSVPHVQKVIQQLKGCQMINGYGPTENTTFTCCYPITESSQIDHSVPIGRPIANTQVYILDSQLQLLPIGVPGEIYIGGRGLARGYFNRPDLTAEKFISNPFKKAEGKGQKAEIINFHETSSDRLYKTGDLARYLPDGNIEYLGRIDHQVKIRGFRIELGEIETALLKHPDVREAFVIASPDQRGDQRLVSYIVSNLIPDRLPYQTVVSVELEDKTILQLNTEDISIGGICLLGVPTTWQCGQIIRLQLLLPGNTEECWLTGNIAWQQGQKTGIKFITSATQQAQLNRSLDYLLQAQGFLKVLQRTVTQNLRQFLQRQLPNYMIPASFVLMRALPLTPNGKLDRKALPDPEMLAQLEVADLAPKSEIEQTLAQVWQQVLQIERVGINDNFFDLGGHSLLIVQVQSKLQEVLNTKISIVDLFKYPTISTLAQYLNQQPSEEAPVKQINDSASADLSVRVQKQKQALNKQKQRRR